MARAARPRLPVRRALRFTLVAGEADREVLVPLLLLAPLTPVLGDLLMVLGALELGALVSGASGASAPLLAFVPLVELF